LGAGRRGSTPKGGGPREGGSTVRTRFLIVVALAVFVGTVERPPLALASGIHDQFTYLLAPGFFVRDYCLVSPMHRHLDFYRDFPAQNADGTVNSVVEIPAGTNEKFEVSEDTGKMCWEFKNGVPRVVNYLGYPGNYGMVPRTLGGDGDSLDVVTLGKFQRRGAVVKAKLIGVLHLLDGGDVDDKLIAVLPDTGFYAYDNLSELELANPGVTTILETWFENYKGLGGGLEVLGFGDAAEAQQVLDAAKLAYQ
jgi:inorganic pyrophosphatase